ncbi:MAG: PqqD family protein [Acidobacteriota bacterium]|jgi:hypothetical protein
MALRKWFLACRPVRRLEWHEEDQRVIVLRPRLGESKIGRKLARMLGFPDYRIRLDEIGTVVWKWCDGESTAAEIAGKMKERFGAKVEPAQERLQTFILQMSRARMIEIRVEQSPPDQEDV